MAKIFRTELPQECDKAIKELKRLKVYRIMNDDMIENFADVWFRVQTECDLFEYGDNEDMTEQNYNASIKWLNRWEDLYDKYEDK